MGQLDQQSPTQQPTVKSFGGREALERFCQAPCSLSTLCSISGLPLECLSIQLLASSQAPHTWPFWRKPLFLVSPTPLHSDQGLSGSLTPGQRPQAGKRQYAVTMLTDCVTWSKCQHPLSLILLSCKSHTPWGCLDTTLTLATENPTLCPTLETGSWACPSLCSRPCPIFQSQQLVVGSSWQGRCLLSVRGILPSSCCPPNPNPPPSQVWAKLLPTAFCGHRLWPSWPQWLGRQPGC